MSLKMAAKLLAIDTSTHKASVAISDTQGIVLQESLENQKAQAQNLLPIIARLLAKANLTISELDGIVFGRGPGSFTGLRIACSLAKGLAYAHNIPLIPVGSLSSIAHALRHTFPAYANTAVLAVLDARMQELYWGYFEPQNLQAEDRLSTASLLYLPDNKPVVLAGVGFESYLLGLTESVKKQLTESITIYPEAKFLIDLAKSNVFCAVSAADAKPIYVRNTVTQGEKCG
jgi:tRNA threonylcarbamoyladenosine biosynthesis protein TsaB